MDYRKRMVLTVVFATLGAVCTTCVNDGGVVFFAQNTYPASDPQNTGNWALRTDMSDEFDGASIDSDKWYVSRADGKHEWTWKGRQPSQFVPENVSVKNGKLYLTTKWEPDYDFANGYNIYTTASVISQKTLQYGYLEIKCKASDVSFTSSFWLKSKTAEVDIFEFVGDSKVFERFDTLFEFCIHNTALRDETWKDSVTLPWRVASGFHVYGCEWDETGIKFYADGKLVTDAPNEKTLNPITVPMYIWMDSEAFIWHGFPDKDELPADYEIEHIRVWQKQTATE